MKKILLSILSFNIFVFSYAFLMPVNAFTNSNNANNIYSENERKYQEELRKKYNPDNLFKNKQKTTDENVEETAMIEYKKENIFSKIMTFLKNLFKL